MVAVLRLSNRRVQAAKADGEAAVTVNISPEALPRLLLGQLSVGDAFLQDWLSLYRGGCAATPQPGVSEAGGSTAHAGGLDRMAALRVLDALFPRLPLWMPRAQWW